MTTEEQREVDLLKNATLNLGEHFETVQIFVTRHQSETEDDTGTVNLNYGIGNWFVRIGFVKDWVIRQDEWTRCYARNKDKEDS